LRIPSDQHRSGELAFLPDLTSGPNSAGLGVAGFLLGDVTSFQRYVSSSLTAGERQWRTFYYAQDTWSSERLGLSLTGGGRIEHSSATGETLFSPRGSFLWSIDKDWKVRAAAGRYYQFPDFEQTFGRLGNPRLRSESASHYNGSVERRFGDRTMR